VANRTEGGDMNGKFKMANTKEMWFGCPKCGYKPERDGEKSNKNWNVFVPGNCPECNTEMRINFIPLAQKEG
jgi:hypothetical protein